MNYKVCPATEQLHCARELSLALVPPFPDGQQYRMMQIDWNMAWQQARRAKKQDRSDSNRWNKRAPEFAEHVRKSSYAENFIQRLAPEPTWSVLDVGCGAGTLALPLAHHVHQVTAIDFSEVMIELLNQECRAQELGNIRTSVTGWEDDWEAAGIGMHDLAIASRSLVVDDLRGAVEKLNRKARKRVVVVSLVGDGPFDRRIFDAIGRELDRGPDYIYVYNLLHQMGLYAEVSLLPNNDPPAVYMDIDEAMQKLEWMIDAPSEEERRRLRRYLECHLSKTRGGWRFSYQHPVHWAVISWNTEVLHTHTEEG